MQVIQQPRRRSAAAGVHRQLAAIDPCEARLPQPTARVLDSARKPRRPVTFDSAV